jgi:5-methylcytosine-specific restriction endonuclease McrBC regulatory subunit McrC
MFQESKEDVEVLAEAIAKTFVQRVNTALRRGVLQGYNEVEESMATVRGRVRWNEQIRFAKRIYVNNNKQPALWSHATCRSLL